MTIKSSTVIQTKFGPFKVVYHNNKKYQIVSFSKGNLSEDTPIIRFHSACLFSEAFNSLHCDCDDQLKNAMKIIQKHGRGIIIYSYQEGRGIGLLNKIKAMEIQKLRKCDTVEAFKKLGYKKSDYRDYHAEVHALDELGVSKKIITFSGNPKKIKALKEAGYDIKKTTNIKSKNLGKLAKEELSVKIKKMGYVY